MPIINKTKNTAAIYNRGREVVKVYDHGKLAWQKSTSIPDYLCFTALEAGQFTLTIPAAVTPTYLSYVEWSKDGRTWNHTDNTSEAVTIDVQVASGDKVYWRGSGSALGPSFTEGGRCIFSSSANFDASGHLMSLLVGDNFANYEHLTHFNTDGIRNATFSYLFKGCNTLVNAKDLVLPTFESYHLYIYYYTFRECSSLVSQPPLLSTNLAQACYYGMYYDCTSLTASATLPAATLQESCYRYMYYNCTNLETVNPILATTASGTNCMNQMFRICKKITRVELHLTGALTQACCYQMFQLCSALSYVKCLATDISATNCVTNWLASVSSTGTFIQASGATWPRGASGIPTGWLAYDEGEEIPNDYTPCDYIFNPSSASAAAVAIGTTSGINEPFEVDFQATEIVVSDRPVVGYGSSNSSVSPVQGSMSYFYLRNSNDSFQHQVFRLNTSGDTLASTNGLLKNGRDLDRHTAKVTYTYNESTGHYLRNLYFDGVLTHSSTTVHPTPLIGTGFYVFGFSSSSSRFINGKIYGLRWWEEDEVTLKANLFPCSRNSDGAAGFWDTTQEQFFTSTYWTAHNDNE